MPTISQLTPVRVVPSVEPSIAFWRDRFGFRVENEVPGPDGTLIFASVTNGEVELMYQTVASVLADTPDSERDAKADELRGDATVLFLQVDNIDETERALAGAPLVKARHTTFYGTTEIYVREPAGMIVGFSVRNA